MAQLFLARHGETAWNASRRLTGTTDISITAKGKAQAADIANSLHGLRVDLAYASDLKRTHQTLAVIMSVLRVPDLAHHHRASFNERHCGIYTGAYKETLDDELLCLLDKDWTFVPPQGESLEMVSKRVVDAFESEIAPKLREGKNILIVSHYNPMRLLKAYIEGVPEQERGNKGVGNGELIVLDY